MKVIGRLFLIVLVGLLFVGCGKKSGIEGKVVDVKGKPLANIKIMANQVQPIKGYEHFEATTGSDGAFRFKGLFPASEYTLFAWGEVLEPQTKITVKSGPEGQISMLTSDLVILFTNPKDGVITDATTGLQWAQDAGRQVMTWDEANNYVRKFKLGGYSDWRLPTKEELESLLTYCEEKGIRAEIFSDWKCVKFYNKIGFKNVQPVAYWSSTTFEAYAASTGHAWAVHMWGGSAIIHKTDDTYNYVWPVRSGQ